MFENFLNLIYPKTCIVCDKIYKNSLCPKCNAKIKKLLICNIQNVQSKSFICHAYLFKYKDIIRKILIDYKFNEKSYIFRGFVEIILKNKKMCDMFQNYDIIIPVPMYKSKKSQRGYNQTALIARDVAKKLHIEYVDDALIKIKDNVAQSSLKKSERKENIKNAFYVDNINKIENKKILLFDDIYTTGNTVEECSKVLLKSGVESVGVFTIAKN